MRALAKEEHKRSECSCAYRLYVGSSAANMEIHELLTWRDRPPLTARVTALMPIIAASSRSTACLQHHHAVTLDSRKPVNTALL